MNEILLLYKTYYELQRSIANKIKVIRKRKKISQKRLSILSDVPYASIRRFENTGEISFSSFVKITQALGLGDELERVYEPPKYTSIEEVLNDR